MSAFGIRRKKRNAAVIDIAPMMDMVFILLIFFIVTSTFTRETGLDVTKPRASTATDLARESILVGVSRQGTVHINETRVNISSLRSILQGMMAEAPDRPVIIVADRGAPTGKVVDVMDECNLAHVSKVSLAATRD